MEETPRHGRLSFFFYFFRAYKLRSAVMIALLILAGMLEGISVVALLPLLEVAIGRGQGPHSRLGQFMAEGLHTLGLQPSLPVLAAFIVLAITLKAVLIWLGMREVGYTVARVTLDLRLRLVRAVLRARWHYFGSQPIGRFAAGVSSEAVASAAAYQQACSVIASFAQIAVYLLISAAISWQVTVVALVLGVTLVIALRRFVAMSRAAGKEQARLTRSLTSRLMDALQGIKPMKAMAREELFWPLLEDEAQGLNEAQRARVVAAESLRLFQEPIITLFLTAGLVGLLMLTDRSFSSVIVLAFIFYRLMTNFRTLQMQYQVMTTGEGAFWQLRDQIEAAEREAEAHTGDKGIDGLRDRIELKQVDFAYDDLQVLDGLDMVIPAGRMTALLGQSGSGKTTILDLITGLQRPQAGEVFVDGIALGELDLTAWRSRIGYVPQEVFLFHDTIRRNITLGDESIDDARVEKALRDAGAWDFVARNSAGIDALISPQGSNLSGGQRQRLAIARALVKRPTLMVLDEATTGLDTRTEAGILETLRRLKGKVTILAVSHQPALRQTADLVIELVDGRITAVDASGSEVSAASGR